MMKKQKKMKMNKWNLEKMKFKYNSIIYYIKINKLKMKKQIAF